MSKTSYLETIKAHDGKIFHIDYHQKRYESVLNSLGVEKYENLQDHLNPPTHGLYRCRLTYNNDKIDVTYHAYEKKIINSLKLVYEDKIEYSKKSTDRTTLDELYAKRGNCDDILIVRNSLLADTSIANIALYKEGVWYTPSSPLLKGTTRQRLLDSGYLIQKDISVNDLKSFTRVALLNAMIDFDIIANISYEI